MNNITLIGMPGVGKSTIGVVLAKVLGYQFLDSDLLIQKQENRRLWQIIEEEGYEGFQNVENRVNASIEAENTVIATGGSVVYCEEAMKHLKSVGTVVYFRENGVYQPYEIVNQGAPPHQGEQFSQYGYGSTLAVFIIIESILVVYILRKIFTSKEQKEEKRIEKDTLTAIIESRDREKAGRTAPI